MGGAGFIAGFAGPIIHWPASNQGPLLGIFFMGPLGAVLGALLWFILLIVAVVTKRPLRLVMPLVLATIVYGSACWLYIAITPDAGVGRP